MLKSHQVMLNVERTAVKRYILLKSYLRNIVNPFCCINFPVLILCIDFFICSRLKLEKQILTHLFRAGQITLFFL